MPGGVNSPVRSFGAMGIAPMIVASGQGDTLVDADGNRYIDYCGSWGALILGHAHPAVVAAASAQMARGSTFGITTELEEQLARKVVELIPSVEKVRFVSSGTEATMTALRLARGWTGRSKIVKFAGHYHGHSDLLLVQAGSGVASLNPVATSKGLAPGAIADTIVLPFNDVAALKAIGSDVAAVILEPVAGNMGVVPAERPFMEALREVTEKSGALLIFDEVINGFRLGLQGAQGLYGVRPDLSCYSKILGGGFPIGAVGGRREILDQLAPLGQVYQAGTLSGNPVAAAAALATLEELVKPGFYEGLEAKTRFLVEPLQKAGLCVQQVGSMFTIFFGVERVRTRADLDRLDKERYAALFRYLFERGVYLPPHSNEAAFVSSAHTEEHLAQTRDLILEYYTAIS